MQKLALITFLGGGEHADHDLPGAPARPGHDLPPSGAHPWFPGHRPPSGEQLPAPPPVTPDNTLPTPPEGPVISLPIFLPPVTPDNTLPTTPPPAGTKPVEPTPPPAGTKPTPPPAAGTKPVEPGKPLDPSIKFELKWTEKYGWVLVWIHPTHDVPKPTPMR